MCERSSENSNVLKVILQIWPSRKKLLSKFWDSQCLQFSISWSDSFCKVSQIVLSIRLFQRSRLKCVWKTMEFYKTFINNFKSICSSCVHFKFNVLNPWIQGQVHTIQVLLGAISLFINFIQSLIIHSSSRVLHENRVHINFTYYKAGVYSKFPFSISSPNLIPNSTFQGYIQKSTHHSSFKFHKKLTRLQSDFWILKSSPLSFNFLSVQDLHPKYCSKSKNVQLLKNLQACNYKKSYVTNS